MASAAASARRSETTALASFCRFAPWIAVAASTSAAACLALASRRSATAALASRCRFAPWIAVAAPASAAS